MAFVVLGVLLMGLKVAEYGPVGSWSWWAVLWPFALAVLWWAYADKVGLTKRREMDKMERRKAERRRKQMEALGMDPRNSDRLQRLKGSSSAAKREQGRAQARARNKDVMARSSRLDSVQSSQFDSRVDPKTPL